MITKAYNRIKEGIVWIKNNPKKAFLALLGIGVVGAAPLLIPSVTDINKYEIAPITFQGKQISFPCTDGQDHTGETVAIRTDNCNIVSWGGDSDNVYTYVAVANLSQDDQNFQIQAFHSGGSEFVKLEEMKFQVPYQREVPDYTNTDYECKGGWKPSSNFIEYSCGKTIRYCSSVSGNFCTIKEQTGSHTETYYVDEYATIAKNPTPDGSLDLLSKKREDSKMVLKEQIQYWIPSGETRYFRAKLKLPHGKGLQGKFSVKAFGSLNAIGSIDPSWYSSSWGYRTEVQIDYTKVATTTALTDFPVLIATTTNNLKFTGSGGYVGKSDGTDILVTSSDGTTKLSHEIEKYSSSTGETILWVKVPGPISTSSNTSLYVYYGNSGASDQQDATNVWSNSFVSVWHLGDSDSYSLNDSKNVNNAAQSGTINNGTGQMGYGIDIGGGTNYASSTTTNFPTGTGSVTMSYWLKLDSGSGWAGILGYGTSAYVRAFSAYNYYSINLHQLWGGGGTAKDISSTVPTTFRYYSTHITGTNTYATYENGTLIGSGFYASGDNWNILPATMYMGIGSIGYGSMDGVLDEVRISSVSRPVAWIKTEYNNQNSPGTFIIWGTQEQDTPAATTGVRRVLIIE